MDREAWQAAVQFSSVQFSHSVMSDSVQPQRPNCVQIFATHIWQHVSIPCPSLDPVVCLNSYPLSWWCYPTILSSVAPFFSCPQSFGASGSFPVSQLFASGGQSIGASALASVLSVTIQSWFPLELTGLILLPVQGTLKSLLQQHNSKASILWHLAFFLVRLSHLYHSFDYMDLC